MHAGQLKFSNVEQFEQTAATERREAGSAGRVASNEMTICIHQDTQALEGEWRALQTLDINSLHHGFDWCRVWINAYQRPLRIVEGRLNGEIAFILPLEIVRGHLFTKAQFIGAQHANVNTGLLSPAFLQHATPALMRSITDEICATLTGADCVILGNMPGLWRDQILPFSMLEHIENQNRAFQLPLKASFVETLAQLNAKRRRKKYSVGHRRLESLGGYEHVIAETDAEKHELLDLFFTQKAARLAEFGLPNTFACPSTRKFLHSIAGLPQTESQFPLRMHAIRMTGGDHKGEIPAVAGLSRKGDHLIVQFCSIGSGPATEASPGELLFHLMIEKYNQENVAVFDFGIGDMPFKRAWCTQETVQVNVTLPVTPLGRLAVLKEEMATKLKAMIKQNPAVYSFVQKLRSRSQSAVDPDEKPSD